ncbi:hypothetical protein [Streptomyces sp. NPDC127098]|uniref:hypothetical protein n=1 Tax=Streptomyces sp. NPDC127098 TaxID=3347137 RepID=UPI00364C1C70
MEEQGLVRRTAAAGCYLPARSEAMIQLAMTDLMARRLTDEATITWRDPRIPGSNLQCGIKHREKATS